MFRAQAIMNKKRLATWLLNVTLFVSFFMFSGYQDHNRQEQQGAKTELISSPKTTSKQTVSYKRGLAFCYKNNLTPRPGRGEINRSLMHYAAYIKIMLNNTAAVILSFEMPDLLLKVTSTPPTSEEDASASLRG